MLTSGPGMNRRAQWMNDVCENVFWILYKDKCMSSLNILLHSVNKQRLARFSITQCTCSPEILLKGNQAHSTSIFMSYLHLHDLHTTLSESCFPSRQTDTLHHTETVCVKVNCSTHPTCPNQDRTDLYQAVLVNMPRAMKLANICVVVCVFVCVPEGLRPSGISFFPHEHLHALSDYGDQKSFIWSEWWTVHDSSLAAYISMLVYTDSLW